MEQIVLNVENKSILPSLKRVLGNINGVTIAKKPMAVGKATYSQAKPAAKEKKTELDLAIEEVRAGRVSRVFTSADELCRHLGI